MKTSVERKIASIAEQLGITYLYDNWATANVRLDKEKMPVMINVLPVSGKFSLSRVQIRDCPNCMLAFADLTELDFDGVDNDEVIERCKSHAIDFIKRLNNSGLFEPVDGDITYSVFYDKLDVNITGVVIELQLKEVHGVPMC
jgi:hypothetical protein